MKRTWLGVVVSGCLTLMGLFGAPAMASETGEIKTKLDGGNARGALRQADKVLLKVMGLKIQAQSKLGQASGALRTYEVLVALTGRENLKLLEAVAWAYVTKIFKSNNRRSQQMVAKYLGDSKNRKAVKPLSALLKRASDFVTVRYVSEALGKIGDDAAVPALLSKLNIRSFYTRTSVAWALGKLNNAKGLKMLERCFKTGRGGQKLRCAYMLARLNKRSVRSYLRKQLRSNKSRRAREVIAKGLSALGDKRWRRIVEKDLRSRLEETRLISARVLGELKSRRSQRGLQRALRDRSLLVRLTAAKSLGMIGSDKGTGVLEKALGNSKAAIRAQAAEALAHVKASSTRAALIKALSDKNLRVRARAAHGLISLKRQEGGGVLREAFGRGNLPLQAIAVAVALEASSKGSLAGKPVNPMKGEIAPATNVNAFEDKGGEEDDDSFNEGSKAKSGKKSRRTRKTRRTRRNRRARPVRRRKAGGDDDDDDW